MSPPTHTHLTLSCLIIITINTKITITFFDHSRMLKKEGFQQLCVSTTMTPSHWAGKQSPHSLALIDERGGGVLLWLECTQRNAMDGHSRVNSAHSTPGGRISSWSITCFDIGTVVKPLPLASQASDMEDRVHWHTGLWQVSATSHNHFYSSLPSSLPSAANVEA